MATTLTPLPDAEIVATLVDDIPDPATPAAIVAAAADDTMDLNKLKDLCVLYVHEAMAALTDDARLLLARLAAPPVYNEQAKIIARSPEGFTVELQTAKTTPGDLIAAVQAMVAWCKSNGYTPV